MYSSKPLHKNVALFTKHGISSGIGDPYGKKHKVDSKRSGRQFQAGKRGSDYFGGMMPLSMFPTKNGDYKSDSYAAPPHKPDTKQLSQEAGFGSKNGRGIQNSVRASRMYSEKLGMENKALKRTLRNAGSSILLDTNAAAASAPAITLYDRCNAGEADDSLRLKPGVGSSKRIGSMTTTGNIYGANVSDSPPVSGKHSRVAVTKSFYNDQALESAGNNEYLNM